MRQFVRWVIAIVRGVPSAEVCADCGQPSGAEHKDAFHPFRQIQ